MMKFTRIPDMTQEKRKDIKERLLNDLFMYMESVMMNDISTGFKEERAAHIANIPKIAKVIGSLVQLDEAKKIVSMDI